MPNNRAKIKFDSRYLIRVQNARYAIPSFMKMIKPKFREGQWGNANRVVSALFAIEQYAYVNVKAVPYSDEHSIIKYDMNSLLKIRNAKQSLKTLFGLVTKPTPQYKNVYAAALDLFNQFQTHLEGLVQEAE